MEHLHLAILLLQFSFDLLGLLHQKIEQLLQFLLLLVSYKQVHLNQLLHSN